VVINVAPPIVHAHREIYFRGIHPFGSRGEEKPPRTMQRKMDREHITPKVVQIQRELGFKRNMRSQSDPNLRERWESIGSSPQFQLGERDII